MYAREATRGAGTQRTVEGDARRGVVGRGEARGPPREFAKIFGQHIFGERERSADRTKRRSLRRRRRRIVVVRSTTDRSDDDLQNLAEQIERKVRTNSEGARWRRGAVRSDGGGGFREFV